MDLIQTGSTQIFGKFLLWGVIIFLFFTILRFGLPIVIKSQKRQIYIKQILLITELVAWIFYLCWFILLFLKSGSFFVIILMSVLLFILFVIGRMWLVDLIAGVIFKSGAQLKKGDYLEKDDFKGVVNKLGSRFLVLENMDGNKIQIPYHKITASVFKKDETIDQKSGYSFELDIKSPKSSEALKSQIQKSILTLPWSSIHKNPIITLTEHSQEFFRFKLTVFAIDKSFASKIENHIKKQFKSP